MSVRHSLAASLAATVVATLVAGCSSLRAHGGSGDPVPVGRSGVGIPMRSPTDPTRVPSGEPRGDLPSSTQHATASESRRICRTGSWPSGWIAVAYDADPGAECPKGKADYPIAVLVRYANQAPNATLDVCADQRVPQNWSKEVESADVGECPGAVRGGGSATMRIRRVR